MRIFDHLTNLTTEKKSFDPLNNEQNKSYTPYMINRFISMCELYLPIVNEINKYNISKKTHYEYYLSALPKRKQFFKYISKGKDVNKDKKELISKYFDCGTRDTELYLKILPEDKINEIVKKFDYGKTR